MSVKTILKVAGSTLVAMWVANYASSRNATAARLFRGAAITGAVQSGASAGTVNI